MRSPLGRITQTGALMTRELVAMFTVALSACGGSSHVAPLPPDAMATLLPYAALMRDVGGALEWEPLAKRTGSESEETRVWFGFGNEWPNTVLRLERRQTGIDGQIAFWWSKGTYAGSIRKSLQDERDCSAVADGKNVQVCVLPSNKDWAAIWDSLKVRDIPGLAGEGHKESGTWTPTAQDMAVERWSGDTYQVSVHRMDRQEAHAKRLACTFRAVLLPSDEAPEELDC
jgi:hypothetical protein